MKLVESLNAGSCLSHAGGRTDYAAEAWWFYLILFDCGTIILKASRSLSVQKSCHGGRDPTAGTN